MKRVMLCVCFLLLFVGDTHSVHALSRLRLFPLKPGDLPGNLFAGRHNDFWSIVSGRTTIAHIDETGEITEIPFPPAIMNLGIASIAVGLDDTLWGITPSDKHITAWKPGHAPAFSVAHAFPASLLIAPDGALWVAEYMQHALDQGSTWSIERFYKGKSALFAISKDLNGGLGNMVIGTDKAIWFTDDWDNKIIRVTMSGKVTQYTVPLLGGGAPNPSSYPTTLTVGGDGALWFTQRADATYGHFWEN